MKTIGIMTVPDDFVPNMQAAYETDLEVGSHAQNNRMSELFNKGYPTIIEMARLIEEERDALSTGCARLAKENGRLISLAKASDALFEELVSIYADHAYYPQLKLPIHQAERLDNAMKAFAKSTGRKW